MFGESFFYVCLLLKLSANIEYKMLHRQCMLIGPVSKKKQCDMNGRSRAQNVLFSFFVFSPTPKSLSSNKQIKVPLNKFVQIENIVKLLKIKF